MSDVPAIWPTEQTLIPMDHIKIGDAAMAMPPDKGMPVVCFVMDKFDHGVVLMADGGTIFKFYGSTIQKVQRW